MRVGSHHKRSRHNVAALDHDLVADAGTSGIEINLVLFRKGFNRTVFLLIRFILVLNVVIESKNQLLRIIDLLRPNALELAHHGRGVVVSHHTMRANGEEVCRAQGSQGPLRHMNLSNLLNNSLSHAKPPYSPTNPQPPPSAA